MDFAFVDLEADVIKGTDAAELFGDGREGDYGFHFTSDPALNLATCPSTNPNTFNPSCLGSRTSSPFPPKALMEVAFASKSITVAFSSLTFFRDKRSRPLLKA